MLVASFSGLYLFITHFTCYSYIILIDQSNKWQLTNCKCDTLDAQKGLGQIDRKITQIL